MKVSLRPLVGALALSAALTAPVAAQDQLNIIMITHGAASDGFWAPVKKGAEDAAVQIGATVSYQAPVSGADMVAINSLIQSAITQEPDGLIVTVPDVDSLADSIRAAVDAGIPTISINSGFGTQDRTGTMFFVGEDLYEAGKIAGERLKEAGGTKVACLHVQPGNVALDVLCQGLGDGFGSPAEVIPFGFDPSEVAAKVRGILESDTGIDALFSMNAVGATTAADIVAELGLEGKVAQGTLNISPEVLNYIIDGRIGFTIDQQPYMQGYLPVIALGLRARYGIEFYTDHIGSGPIVVDASNAEAVMTAAQGGYR